MKNMISWRSKIAFSFLTGTIFFSGCTTELINTGKDKQKDNYFRGTKAVFTQEDLFNYPFPSNIVIALPESFKGYQTNVLTFKEFYIDEFNYFKFDNFLILDEKAFKNKEEFQTYLVDTTGKSALLKIKHLAFSKYFSPPPQNNPPIPFDEGKAVVKIIDPQDIQITIKENIKISSEEVRKLKLEPDPLAIFKPVPVNKKFAVPVPARDGGKAKYAVVSDIGDIIEFVNQDEFKLDEITEILAAKSTQL